MMRHHAFISPPESLLQAGVVGTGLPNSLKALGGASIHMKMIRWRSANGNSGGSPFDPRPLPVQRL